MSVSDFTPLLGLPYLLSNQARKHVILNEGLRAIDGGMHLSVADRDVGDPPAAPTEGDRYLVAAPATDNWAGHEGEVALYSDGGWIFLSPRSGWRVWIENEAVLLVFDGAVWRTIIPDALQEIQLLGLGATADVANPFLAKLNATLFTALDTSSGGTGDLRFKLNKEASGNVLSLLFQDNYVSRAEVGLVGDDDFLIKVSPDGSVFYEGIRINKDSGQVSFPNGSANFREQLTSDRTYYVDGTFGSDSNSGLSSGAGALATIGKAISLAFNTLDFAGHDVTIRVADGTYTENIELNALHTGGGTLKLVGNPTTPSNCVLSTSGNILTATNGARLTLGGFKLSTSSGSCIIVSNGARIYIDEHMEFGSASFAQVFVNGSTSEVYVDADFTISGGASKLFHIAKGGALVMSLRTITFSGSINYSAQLLYAEVNATAHFYGNTFAGDYALVTGNRYAISVNSSLFVNGAGASYIPGDVAGTVSGDAQYV